MKNYFIWFKLNDDLDNDLKSQYSQGIHTYIFQNGKKLKRNSNAFFHKSTLSAENVKNDIIEMCDGKIKLFVISIINSSFTSFVPLCDYDGWLAESAWDFLEG